MRSSSVGMTDAHTLDLSLLIGSRTRIVARAIQLQTQPATPGHYLRTGRRVVLTDAHPES
jgi:hypothetical protein